MHARTPSYRNHEQDFKSFKSRTPLLNRSLDVTNQHHFRDFCVGNSLLKDRRVLRFHTDNNETAFKFREKTNAITIVSFLFEIISCLSVLLQAVFSGMTVSTCIWGYVSDNFGRKKVTWKLVCPLPSENVGDTNKVIYCQPCC